MQQVQIWIPIFSGQSALHCRRGSGEWLSERRRSNVRGTCLSTGMWRSRTSSTTSKASWIGLPSMPKCPFVSLSGFTDVGERAGSESPSVKAAASSVLGPGPNTCSLSPPVKEPLILMKESVLLSLRLAAAADTAGSAKRGVSCDGEGWHDQ